jgi:hypothetical protein
MSEPTATLQKNVAAMDKARAAAIALAATWG